MNTQPKPNRLIITLPKRTSANCKRLLPENHPHHFVTCSFKCHQAYQATLAEIEAADKQREEYPF